MNQEQIAQMQIIEQESNNLNHHLELIEQNIKEIEELKESLIEIENSNEKEILANLGKRIYIPVEIKEKELIVEVGNKTFVKKSIKDTLILIDEQIEKLNLAKDKINMDLESLQERINKLMENIESESYNNKHPKNCKGHNCNCNHCEDDECECN